LNKNYAVSVEDDTLNVLLQNERYVDYKTH